MGKACPRWPIDKMEVQRLVLMCQDLVYTTIPREEGLVFFSPEGNCKWLEGCIPSTLLSQNLNVGNKTKNLMV